MNIHKRRLDGVFEIRPSPKMDARGFFLRTYDASLFRKFSIERNWVQENHSLSHKPGVVRGLHFQFPPHSETKLIRCIRGAIFDVFVDLRKGSPTFGQWDAIRLTEENKKMVLIPRGFAHGFCTLTENCEVLYKVDNYYAPEAEGGLLWSDPELAIPWPVQNPLLSDKDARQMTFQEFCEKYGDIALTNMERQVERQTV